MEEKVIVKSPPKSPVLAGLLSFFFPFGIGAFYNGEVIKGFIYLVLFAGLVSMQPHGAQPFVALLLAGFYFFQIIDSIHTAKRINRRTLLGKEAEAEEEQLSLIVKSGSIFWGIVLMAMGGILLLANFDAISYDTVFDFWPLVVIVIGLKLIVDYFAKPKR